MTATATITATASAALPLRPSREAAATGPLARMLARWRRGAAPSRGPFLARLRRFPAATAGVAAIEFALILPVMTTLYVGGVEVTDALGAKRRVSHAASAISDLVAQDTSVTTTAEMQDMFDAARAIISPFDNSLLKISVAGVTIDSKGKATVSWGQAINGAACPAKGTAVSVPSALATPSSFLIMVQAQYTYTPKIGYVMTGSFDLKNKMFQPPRSGKAISGPSCG